MNKVWMILSGNGDAVICDTADAVSKYVEKRWVEGEKSDVIGTYTSEDQTKAVFMVVNTKEMIVAKLMNVYTKEVL